LSIYFVTLFCLSFSAMQTENTYRDKALNYPSICVIQLFYRLLFHTIGISIVIWKDTFIACHHLWRHMNDSYNIVDNDWILN
jgi:hypothetical protein